MKVNCREKNMCIFCTYWLGEKPEINFRTGDSMVKERKGLCSKDSEERYHKSSSSCNKFQRDILYL